jgi:hypothetical protein
MKQGVKFHVPFSYSISTYHCLYHPDTMKGIIHVQAATPGGNPTAGNTTSSSSAMPKVQHLHHPQPQQVPNTKIRTCIRKITFHSAAVINQKNPPIFLFFYNMLLTLILFLLTKFEITPWGI